ncbi:hypothetical protein C8J56DRAFT_353490 [Mycena floridula]|nr:hypothetical protein C8J56DRAFT_353490 [Mycena floridula]
MPRSNATVSPRATCHICHRTLSRANDLSRHIKSCHSPAETKAFCCPFAGCTYSNSQKSNLKTHINTHTGEQSSKCPNCPFKSTDPGSLTRHRKRLHNYIPKPRKSNAKPRGPSPTESDWTSSDSSSSASSSPSPSASFLLDPLQEYVTAPGPKVLISAFDPAASFGLLPDLDDLPNMTFDQEQLQYVDYTVSTSFDFVGEFNQYFVVPMDSYEKSYMVEPMQSYSGEPSYPLPSSEPMQNASWEYQNSYQQIPQFYPSQYQQLAPTSYQYGLPSGLWY